MNKKIIVIDLIDRIYHKNNIPKKIKFNNKIWLYDNVEESYCLEDSFVSLAFETDRLTDEVEILEDNTEEIEELGSWRLAVDENDYNTINYTLDRFGKKIDELVKAVNKLRKEKE